MHNNLETAFEAAAQLGIPKLLDVEDVADFAVRCDHALLVVDSPPSPARTPTSSPL